MKLMIDIPKEVYMAFKNEWLEILSKISGQAIVDTFQNAMPLPDDCKILTKEAYSDLCTRASKASENDEWIPTDKEFPPEDKDVLITYKYSGRRIVTMGYRDGHGCWLRYGAWIPINIVVAWKPMPEPYKEESEK